MHNDFINSMFEIPLGANIIENSGKLYVPIEVMLNKLYLVDYSTDGKQMSFSNLRSPARLIHDYTWDEELLNKDFTIEYTDDSEGITYILLLNDSYTIYENETWYINHHNLPFGRSIIAEDYLVFYQNNDVAPIFIPINSTTLESTIRLFDPNSDSVYIYSLGANSINRHGDIYIPIEIILNKICNVTYTDDNKIQTELIDNNQELINKLEANLGHIAIVDTRDYQYKNTSQDDIVSSSNDFTIIFNDQYVYYYDYMFSNMTSIYENNMWYVLYEDIDDKIGNFVNLGDNLIFSTGIVSVVLPKYSTSEIAVIRVIDYNSGEVMEFPLGANIINKSGKLFVPFELIIRKLSYYEFNSDFTKMIGEYISDPNELIDKLSSDDENIA